MYSIGKTLHSAISAIPDIPAIPALKTKASQGWGGLFGGEHGETCFESLFFKDVVS